MEWPYEYVLYSLLKTLSGILECQGNLPLDIASKHAPETQHAGLRPVLVHNLECPYKWEKLVPVNMQSRG